MQGQFETTRDAENKAAASARVSTRRSLAVQVWCVKHMGLGLITVRWV